ncbi:FAD-dependent oxidoreductase [Streptomyces sp. NPDC002928]|uniref:FAD-dependent oxidoreductase n=1 Tax=Streptomyces sp. NPDC002928 TaxID=3154440 RepID=UPI0033A61F4F
MSRDPNRVVIIGNGPAALRLTTRLHTLGHQGPLTVIGDEPEGAYQRPLLTSLASGELRADHLRLPPHPATTDVRTGTAATALDTARRLIRLGTGGELPYDTLVLATGACPTPPARATALLHPDGTPRPGVTFLRTRADAERLTGARLTVLGAGPLGIETALALRRGGRTVTLVHEGPYPLHRHLSHDTGEFLTRRLTDLGVTLRAGRTVVSHTPGRSRLDDGEELDTDTLVLCTGVRPRTGLARAAGLRTADGILVDDLLRTSDPHIFAIGDCAELHGTAAAGIEAATTQADALAYTLTGTPTPYPPQPRITRLRAPEIDLAWTEQTDGQSESSISVTDRTRARRAHITVRDGRVQGSEILGLPQAVSDVTTLVRAAWPLPTDWPGLLLGTRFGPYTEHADDAGGADAHACAVVCRCNNVTAKDLTAAWEAGHRTVTELAAQTRATTGCGGCTEEVQALCQNLTASRTASHTAGSPR